MRGPKLISEEARRALKNPLVRAGIVLGMGFGGFADGIILHQILGWHHLICYSAHASPPPSGNFNVRIRRTAFFIWRSGW
jgi:uncharacterized membrane protein